MPIDGRRSRNRIAVICAQNSKNKGMYGVNLAAKNTLAGRNWLKGTAGDAMHAIAIL